ncbi:ATP-dependent endonuclease [Bacteroides stercoris]|uniref:ATP-dependent endonuclease n=1 Tax=Bacteroides stercoris TaxID=46506 RepID=A0A412DDS1_BACSE|nr:ATP-dependent endonuclease [Bacteroides stercoris]MDC2315972.1 ATP-dependent endonuclease [Bacteroides stercoris]MDC2319105.1 ATP-dependent endonuclease [Bacteroides stercoris]MDC2322241.1 ATP-dependent endonuclease [Bacteroides stercoris]MDC2325388.1 ATP-dependent endonuclease [Bacteroides stercoris]MDC2328510.1 ATP-dependent endonuclease [Bacteroides stercoris]
MKIQSVHIRNYRKLKNCHIDFGEKKTVLVGANNSGKTSAISAIVWFLKNTERFTLKEFTVTNWALINTIGEKWLEKDSVDDALLSSHQWDNIVPSMDVWINVENGEQYRVNHLIPSLSTWDGKKVGVRGQYVPKDVTKLYTAYKEAKTKARSLEATEEWKEADSPELYPKNLCDFLGKGSNLREYFDVKYYIIDPALDPDDEDEVQTTPDNELGYNPLDGLIKVDTILASRDFSDPEGQTDSEIDTLSKQFQQYYKSSGQEDEELTCEGLKLLGGIVTANKTYDEKLRKTFEVPVGELKNINYPGFQNPEIKIRSKIQIEESIKHDSAVQFAIQGMEELVLPEKYNGLGYRNLISIYLKLIDFREKWLKELSEGKNIEPIHLVFVEEPEAHLHAQAQQVFVKKAFEALCNNKLIEENPWLSTQLVLSTHSNHVVNELDLNCMRYFKRVIDVGEKIPVSKVVNLSSTFGTDDETKQFVTRYIRLTHCDIFFSDAVVLVEGPAEKILVPSFLVKAGLDSYYISVIEVNGRHAHSFRKLIEKIGIAALIVTDIDATDTKVGEDGKEIHPSVITAKGNGYKTGNPSIKSWLSGKEQIDDLLALDEKEKLVNNVRIAFQTPVNVKWDKNKDELTEVCPYTFEDALIFTNLELFRREGLKKMGAITTIANLLKHSNSANELQNKIFKKLESKSGFQKADFAISLLYKDDFVDLVAPVYIQEGLEWMKSYLDSNGNRNEE